MKRRRWWMLAAGLAATLVTLLAAAPAQASTFNSQQLRFFDDTPGAVIYSVYIYGNNQNGVLMGACARTPFHTTDIANIWWSGHTEVWGHRDNSCGNPSDPTNPTTGRAGMHLWIDVPSVFDGYYWRCLSDVPPYSDWSCP